jgi:hypothetical protein
VPFDGFVPSREVCAAASPVGLDFSARSRFLRPRVRRLRVGFSPVLTRRVAACVQSSIFRLFFAQRAAVPCLGFGVSGLAKRAPLRRRLSRFFHRLSIFRPQVCRPILCFARGTPQLDLDFRSTAAPRASLTRTRGSAPASFSVLLKRAQPLLSPVCAPPLSGVWCPLLFSFPQARFRRHR